MLKLSENLKKFRLNRGLTQEQLADIFGVSAQAVSRWENGTTYPDITMLRTIASYFVISIDELIGMEDFRSEAYLKAVIYNAPVTISNYYSAEVNHDLYGG